MKSHPLHLSENLENKSASSQGRVIIHSLSRIRVLHHSFCNVWLLDKFLTGRSPDLDLMIQTGSGHDRQVWMGFETIDHAFFITFDQMNNIFTFFVPKKDMTTIRARYDEFTVWTIKIDAFDWKKGFKLKKIE